MMEFDAFISYSSKDRTVANAACAVLEKASIRCWIAPRDIRPGIEYGAAIVDAIDRCRVMVIIFSESANNSRQITREIERAVSKGVAVVPMRIEQVEPTKSMEYFLGSIHWLDALTRPIETHLQQLAEVVNAILQVEDTQREASAAPAAGDESSYAATREQVARKRIDESNAKESDAKKPARPGWLIPAIAGVACVIVALGGFLFYRARTPAPAAAAHAELVPESVPFGRDVDRATIRADYLPAENHKALAISASRMGFISGQPDDETAKTAAIDSCKRATAAVNATYPCYLYAVGDTVVFTGG